MWQDRESDIKEKGNQLGPSQGSRSSPGDGSRGHLCLPLVYRQAPFFKPSALLKSAMCHRRPHPLHCEPVKTGREAYAKIGAFAILRQLQIGRSPYIKKEGCEMLVAMVLDRPLAEAQSLVRNPGEFVGGGGSFKNRKPVGEVGCCESGMAERSHWWTARCLISLTLSLSLSLTIYLPTYLFSMYLSIYLSLSLSLI